MIVLHPSHALFNQFLPKDSILQPHIRVATANDGIVLNRILLADAIRSASAG